MNAPPRGAHADPDPLAAPFAPLFPSPPRSAPGAGHEPGSTMRYLLRVGSTSTRNNCFIAGLLGSHRRSAQGRTRETLLSYSTYAAGTSLSAAISAMR